jgi:hypothetical protein
LINNAGTGERGSTVDVPASHIHPQPAGNVTGQAPDPPLRVRRNVSEHLFATKTNADPDVLFTLFR